jgi:hypothetical protein
MVRAKGLEPPRLSPPEPKSGVSTISPRPRADGSGLTRSNPNAALYPSRRDTTSNKRYGRSPAILITRLAARTTSGGRHAWCGCRVVPGTGGEPVTGWSIASRPPAPCRVTGRCRGPQSRIPIRAGKPTGGTTRRGGRHASSRFVCPQFVVGPVIPRHPARQFGVGIGPA